jgi:hypothetical protein
MVHPNFSDQAGGMARRPAPFRMEMDAVRRELMARDQRAAQRRRLTQLAIAAAVAALIGAALWALRGGL